MPSTLRDLISDSRVHVFDGAMGTVLYSKGVFVNVCYDELSVKEPRLVESVHEAYVRAGAEVIETNTFGANPVKLAAYGLAILRIPGTRLVLGAALGAAMFPPIALVGPLFTLFDRLGLLNTYLALIIPHAALALPLTLWVLTSYFGEIPRDILKAAEVDGCTPLAALWHILLPVAAPGLATAGILAFIYSWNEFLFALSLAGTGRVQTVTVAIALFPGLEEFPWGQIAAASLIVTLPVIGVVLILQRRIVAGLTAGALGG